MNDAIFEQRAIEIIELMKSISVKFEDLEKKHFETLKSYPHP